MKFVLVELIHLYRLVLSPFMGASCRFSPTCSCYALQAVESHGSLKGLWLTLKRMVRCHPYCKGGHDSVPGLE